MADIYERDPHGPIGPDTTMSLWGTVTIGTWFRIVDSDERGEPTVGYEVHWVLRRSTGTTVTAERDIVLGESADRLQEMRVSVARRLLAKLPDEERPTKRGLRDALADACWRVLDDELCRRGLPFDCVASG